MGLSRTLHMLRLTEVKLPLDHPESEIHTAILKWLGIKADELVGYPTILPALPQPL